MQCLKFKFRFHKTMNNIKQKKKSNISNITYKSDAFIVCSFPMLTETLP